MWPRRVSPSKTARTLRAVSISASLATQRAHRLVLLPTRMSLQSQRRRPSSNSVADAAKHAAPARAGAVVFGRLLRTPADLAGIDEVGRHWLGGLRFARLRM